VAVRNWSAMPSLPPPHPGQPQTAPTQPTSRSSTILQCCRTVVSNLVGCTEHLESVFYHKQTTDVTSGLYSTPSRGRGRAPPPLPLPFPARRQPQRSVRPPPQQARRRGRGRPRAAAGTAARSVGGPGDCGGGLVDAYGAYLSPAGKHRALRCVVAQLARARFPAGSSRQSVSQVFVK